MQFCIHFTAGCGPGVEEANMQKPQVAKWTKNSPGVSLIQAFYFKPRGGFSFHFAADWPKEKPGLFVALWKMEGLVGAHSGFFPSTAGSHYGQRPLKLIISTYRIVVVQNWYSFFLNPGLFIRWLWFAFIPFSSSSEHQPSSTLFLPLPRSAPVPLSWGLCGTPFERLTPNSGCVWLFKLENEM